MCPPHPSLLTVCGGQGLTVQTALESLGTPLPEAGPRTWQGSTPLAAAGVGAGLGQVYVGEDMSTETNRGRQLWRAVPA